MRDDDAGPTPPTTRLSHFLSDFLAVLTPAYCLETS